MSETWLLVIAAGTVLGIAVLAFAAIRLHGLATGFERLEEQLPKPADLQSLGRALDAQRQTTEKLPALVAEKVAGQVEVGLDPLKGEIGRLSEAQQAALGEISEALARSHNHFSQAVLTLNQDGSLSEWVSSLRDTAEPFQKATSSLELHYQTARQLLGSTGELVSQWASQREAVEGAFQHFSAMVERSAAAETTHLRDIEHRVMQRLEEVASTNTTVSQALSELQTTSRNTMASHQNLAQSVQDTVLKVGELADLGQRTQEQHHELVRAQKGVQQGFDAWRQQMERGVAEFQRKLEELPTRVATSLEEKTRTTIEGIQNLGQQLGDAQATHAQQLTDLRQKQEAVIETQTRLVRRQETLVGEVEEWITQLPTRTVQISILALLACQLVVLGVMAYGIFQIG